MVKKCPQRRFSQDFYSDFKILVQNKEHGKLAQRLNKEKMDLIRLLKNYSDKFKETKLIEGQSIKEQIMKVHKRWRDVEYWQAIKEQHHLTQLQNI